jgi:hypothetical protein
VTLRTVWLGSCAPPHCGSLSAANSAGSVWPKSARRTNAALTALHSSTDATPAAASISAASVATEPRSRASVWKARA